MQQPKEKQHVESQKEVDLKGTLVSVGILGLFIIISWLGVWYLFISR